MNIKDLNNFYIPYPYVPFDYKIHRRHEENRILNYNDLHNNKGSYKYPYYLQKYYNKHNIIPGYKNVDGSIRFKNTNWHGGYNHSSSSAINKYIFSYPVNSNKGV